MPYCGLRVSPDVKGLDEHSVGPPPFLCPFSPIARQKKKKKNFKNFKWQIKIQEIKSKENVPQASGYL